MSHLCRFIVVQRAAYANICTGLFKGQRKTFVSSPVNYGEYQTMATVKQNLITVLRPEVTQFQKSREKLFTKMPKSQKDLPVRKMKDSFDSAIVPLSKDLVLREKYTTVFDKVRIGRLMEDLDMIAVWCCVKHILGDVLPEQRQFPYNIVTIGIDHTEVFRYNSQTSSDIRLSGHVCWVGTSSLEVYVWMDQFVDGKWNKILRALILMAARNAANNGPGIVNPIEGETAEEMELLRGGEDRRKKRIQKGKESVLIKVPTTEEFTLIHNLFTNTVDPRNAFVYERVLPPKSKWMQDATLSTLIICHPEHRNLYNKIFGGFIIRKALELSWSMAVSYGMKVPKLIHISDISFYTPVEVGSLLKMCASVTYTEKQYLEIFVYAEAYSLSDREGKSTTSFNFTFDMTTPVDDLYPLTYLDVMKYIEGRRRFLQVMSDSILKSK